MKIDLAVDTFPKGSRHWHLSTHSHNMYREIDITLWKFQLLISIAHTTSLKQATTISP